MADKSFIGKIQGSAAEAKQRAADDAAQRRSEADREGSIILSQKDILTGNWDSRKLLFTTLGGQIRPITVDDMQAFKQNIKTAQSKLIKGVSAKQIIDWSAAPAWGCNESDLKLATDQIRMAVPVSASNGKVRFITNAGPDSKVTRHHVTIEFLNYGAESASGLTDPRKAAMRLRKGPLKIECDCEKWRYWFRYLATIGGFNAGRAETGFPKIRNPKLHGIACKHIVRVASEINSGGATLGFLTKLMNKAKSSDDAKALMRMQQQEAEKVVKGQAMRTTGHDIKTTSQKKAEREAKAILLAASKAVKPQREKRKSRTTVDGTPDEREAVLRASLAAFGITPTPEQIQQVRNAK